MDNALRSRSFSPAGDMLTPKMPRNTAGDNEPDYKIGMFS